MVGNLTRKIKKCQNAIEQSNIIKLEKGRLCSKRFDLVRHCTILFDYQQTIVSSVFAIIYVPVHAHIVNQIRLLRSNLLRTVTSSVNIL